MPRTYDVSEVTSATDTRPCMKYPTKITHNLTELPWATHIRPFSSTQCHSHTCAETCSLINFNLIYEDCWHCRYSSYLCVQRYCIKVQVYEYPLPISVPNFTRLVSIVHKESWNGKMKKLFSQTRHIVIYIVRICYPNASGIPFPALAPYITSGPQRSAASVTPSRKFSASAM